MTSPLRFPPAGATPPVSRRRISWMIAVALLATLAVHVSGLDGELVYDDLQLVGRNPLIADLSNVPKLFTQAYWDFLAPQDAAYTGYWRPLTATALALAHALGDGGPTAFHLVGVLIHLIATMAAFFLARRVTNDPWIGFFSALLFGLHPVQVESVAWISALNDPLFGMFTLLAAVAYLRWRDDGSKGPPLLAALLFAPALLAKELAVALLPILVAIDLGRRRRPEDGSGRLGGFVAPLRAYAPFGVVLLAYYLARVAVFHSPWAGLDRITTGFGVGSLRLAMLRIELLGGSIGLLVLPRGLSLFHTFRPDLSPADPEFLVVVAWSVAALAGAGWMIWRERRPALLALLFVPAGLMPILIRVESLGRFPLSERFLYLPALGFALLLCMVTIRLLPRVPAYVLLLVVAGIYSAQSARRIDTWSDEETLFRAAVDANPRNVYARWGLGRVLLGHYGETRDRTYLTEAFEVFDSTQLLLAEVVQDPDSDIWVSSNDFLQTNLGLGWCLVYEAEFDEFHDFGPPIAIFGRLLEEIERMRRGAEEARGLGITVRSEHLEVELVHTALGVAHMLAGRHERAEEELRAAIAENPRYAEAHQNMGRLMMRKGDPGRARQHFEKALEMRPDRFEDKLLLAQALFEGGEIDRAEGIALELHGRDPASTAAMMVVATAKASRGNPGGALEWLDRTIEADPTHGYAWYRRAKALLELDEHREAILSFRRATEYLPGNFEAHYDFGAYLLRTGTAESAVPYLVRAYALCQEARLAARIREVLRQVPLGSEPAADLARIDRSRRRLDSALEWCELALQSDPESGEAMLLKGRVLFDRGDLVGAEREMSRAAERLPNRFPPHFEVGLVRLRLGRPAAALEALVRALEIGPPGSWPPELQSSTVQEIRDHIADLEAGRLPEFVGPLPPSD